jgi:hypothetical protein
MASKKYNTSTEYLDEYKNRDPFEYNIDSDALYQQYKENYIQQAQLARDDTMGKAAALTGGYGNSYAQTVGQQTYNQYLNQLNAVTPELYSMAYNRYQQEGNDLLNMYSLYKEREDQAYTREQNDKATAKSDLINLMTGAGYNPTDEELNKAGISRNHANAYVDAYSTAGTSNPVDYAVLDIDTQNKWKRSLRGDAKWSNLASAWNDMVSANHDPVKSANVIFQYAYDNGISVTEDDLYDFADMLTSRGMSKEDADSLVGSLAGRYRIASKSPLNTGINAVGNIFKNLGQTFDNWFRG